MGRTKKTSEADETMGKKKKLSRWVRRTALSVVIVVVVVCVTPFAVAEIAAAGRQKTVDTVDPHDVAIVFGAGLEDDGTPSPYLRARLQVAVDLYMAGKAKVILVSGDNLSVTHDEPSAMTQWLIAHGVPDAKIVQDYAGEDTYATCMRANKVFGVTSAILVSQGYHIPRAVATCRMLGVDAVGVGDVTVRADRPWVWWKYWLREVPADANMVWEVVTHRQPILGQYETGVDRALGR